MTVTYACMMSRRKYLPDTITRDNDDAIANALTTIVRSRCNHNNPKILIDVMTDQIDVYLNDHKIATYMFA